MPGEKEPGHGKLGSGLMCRQKEPIEEHKKKRKTVRTKG